MNLKQKYHLLFIGIKFLIFSLIILIDTYDYYIKEKFYEGFGVIAQVMVFDFIGILFAIPFLIKRDFKNLGVIGVFYLLITLSSFLGFSISLILLPVISALGTIKILKLLLKKEKPTVDCI